MLIVMSFASPHAHQSKNLTKETVSYPKWVASYLAYNEHSKKGGGVVE